MSKNSGYGVILQTENKKTVVESKDNILASNVSGYPDTRKKELTL